MLLISLEQNFSLYSDEGRFFLRNLIERLAPAPAHDQKPPSAVILHQKVALSDDDPQWLASLRNKGQWQDLAEQLWQTKSLLHALKHTAIPLLFLGEHHCLGSWWELARSCTLRLWCNPTALLGYKGGSFFTFPFYAASKNRAEFLQECSLWESHESIDADHAQQLGLITSLCFGQNPQGVASNWLKHLSHSARAHGEAKPWPALLERRELQRYFPKWQMQSRQTSSAAIWSLGWLLLKEARGTGPAERLNSALVYTLARYYLGESPALSNAPGFSAAPPRPPLPLALPPRLLAIDIRNCLPPLEPIRRLHSAGVELLFTAPPAEDLEERLGHLYQKLRPILGAEVLSQSWGRSLHWFPHSLSSYLAVQWKAPDEVVLRVGANEQRFLALAGCHLEAELGYWEALPLGKVPNGAESADEADFLAPWLSQQLLEPLCLGILRPRLRELTVPLSVWLRWHFLSELLRLSSQGDGLEKTLELLKSGGWLGLGEAWWWKAFIEQNADRSLSLLNNLGGLLAPERESYFYTSWKKLCRYSEQRSPPTRVLTHPRGESQHMATFAAVLASYLLAHGMFQQFSEADRFTTAALGFPQQYNNLHFYIHKWGEKRFYYYWRKNWPAFILGGTS